MKELFSSARTSSALISGSRACARSIAPSISARTSPGATPGCGLVSTRMVQRSGIIDGPPGNSPPKMRPTAIWSSGPTRAFISSEMSGKWRSLAISSATGSIFSIALTARSLWQVWAERPTVETSK